MSPALFRGLRGFRFGALHSDLVAGLTLAAIAIPEQMATARLGGFSPQIGFYAFIAGTLAFAIFGASRSLSAGADSTITPIFAGAIALLAASGSPEYAALAAALSLMVGVLLIAGGVFRAGWIADLLSVPVMTGFLAGVSIHIVVSQAPALLGLPGGEGGLLTRVRAIASHLGDYNVTSLALGVATLCIVILSESISARIPGALLALAAATFAVEYFELAKDGVAVLGAIPSALPSLSVPHVSLHELLQLVGLSVIITLIVMVQTAAVSRSFAEHGEAPDVDRDFLGVGAGSLFAGLIGAFPVNASPPRTAIVSETGGQSQFAGLTAAALILAVALYGRDLLAQAPTAALAGVLLFVAGRIFRISVMHEIFSKTKSEFALVVITVLAVALLPVQTGVALAIILSLIHGVWTTTRARLIEFERIPGTTVWWPESPKLAGEQVGGVLVVGFQAPLSFLNAYQFHHDFLRAIQRADGGLRLVVLEAGSIVEIDFTAARILWEVVSECREKGVDFALARLESVRAQDALERYGVMAAIGQGRMFHSVDEATRALAPGNEEQAVKREGTAS
jgi:SulP family sulfate permease